MLSAIYGGNSVVKISDYAVIKFGAGVKEDEWLNQTRAFKLLHPDKIRVPEPYHFFSSVGIGYLVMEYVDGTPLEPSDASYTAALQSMIPHLWEIVSDIPGPIGGGSARGLLWSDYHDFRPSKTSEIQAYFNQRRARNSEAALDLEGLPLVLCHADMAARNILKLPDDSFCLLDWESAGFYPRIFDVCAIRLESGREHKELMTDFSKKKAISLGCLKQYVAGKTDSSCEFLRTNAAP